MSPQDLDAAIISAKFAISALDDCSKRLDHWLLFFTALVVLGVALEIIEIRSDHKHEYHAWRWGITWLPEKPNKVLFVVEYFAVILVAAGVGGELAVNVLSMRVNSKLRIANEGLVNLVDRKAGFATSRAVDAKDLADKAAIAAGKAIDSAQQAKSLAHSASEETKIVKTDVREETSQLEQLKKSSGELEAEANKTKSDLINLAVCNAPRVITSWSTGGKKPQSYIDPLLPMAGQLVFIEVVPNDAEARRAAFNIARALDDAKWNLQKPIHMEERIEDGVSVQPSYPPRPGVNGKPPSMDLTWHADEVAETLLEFLHSYNWQASKGWPLDMQGKLIRDPKILPQGAIRIQVGLYPPAIYVSPPGQKALDESREGFRQAREKSKAEADREFKAMLGKMPADVRENAEKRRQEWDREMKKRMSNGPCQVLNPPF